MIEDTPARSHTNAMTVDVEDYFQVQAFASCVTRDSWDARPSRVEQNTMRILEHFSRVNVCGTFFVLGWVAERFPSLVKEILAGGHELASHGYGHELVYRLTPMQFREDVMRAKAVLEAVGGVPIIGYRAPTFSISARTPWAFDILEETGHTYSSSIYPVRHDLYGQSDAARFPHRPRGGALLEIPMTTLRLGERNIPIAGGGYFRLVPYALFRAALKHFRATEKKPGIFYIHPWEIDIQQPKVVGLSQRSKFRHYVNISTVPGRLERLLHDFNWGRVDQVFASELAAT